MFIILPALVLLLFIILCIIWKDWEGLIPGMFLAFIAFLVGAAIDWPVNAVQREDIDLSYNLAAMSDGQSTQGSFFLGFGVVDSVPSYMYYVQDGDGYVLRSWSASSSRVVETSGDPRVVYNCDDYSHVWLPFRWASKMVTDYGDYLDCGHAFVTFYVPPGSVKQQYTLDAQ